jgi:hypothetical protein
MDQHHLHLLLNHFPIVGLIIAIAAFVYAMIRRNKEVFMFSLIAMVVLSLLAIPLHETGEASEDKVENSAGVNHDAIEEHEEASEYATPLMYALGGLSLIAVFILKSRGSLKGWMQGILLVFYLFTLSVMIRTGYLGGLIRRPELRGETVVNTNAATENGGKESGEDH